MSAATAPLKLFTSSDSPKCDRRIKKNPLWILSVKMCAHDPWQFQLNAMDQLDINIIRHANMEIE